GGAACGRRESASSRTPWCAGSSRSSIYDLYLTVFCVSCPSGSAPCHSMRTDGVTCARSSALGDGLRIATVGAIVYAKNDRYLGSDTMPRSSTARITNVWKSDAVAGLLPRIESGCVARKNMICSFFVVVIHTVSVAVGSIG